MGKNWNPTFKINLLDVLAKTEFDSGTKDKLRPFIGTSEFKQLYGQRVVDRIVDRTRDESLDKNNKQFASYSSSYKKSLIFQIYGKDDPPDLTLTGEMLESLNHKASNGWVITFQLEGQNNKNKAAGHKYGIKTKKGKVIRDFLGMKTEDQVDLFVAAMKDYRDDALMEILV